MLLSEDFVRNAHLRAVEICGKHDHRVGQNVGGVSRGKDTITARAKEYTSALHTC